MRKVKDGSLMFLSVPVGSKLGFCLAWFPSALRRSACFLLVKTMKNEKEEILFAFPVFSSPRPELNI